LRCALARRLRQAVERAAASSHHLRNFMS